MYLNYVLFWESKVEQTYQSIERKLSIVMWGTLLRIVRGGPNCLIDLYEAHAHNAHQKKESVYSSIFQIELFALFYCTFLSNSKVCFGVRTPSIKNVGQYAFHNLF